MARIGVTPAKGDWSKMEAHIKKILAADDAASQEYLLHWIAFAFQNLTERAEVAVALMSEAKGTGKGMLGRAIVKAFGAHGLQMLQRSQLTGKFNAHHALTASCSATKPCDRTGLKTTTC